MPSCFSALSRLRSVLALRQLRLGLLNNPLEIGGHHQTGAFLINLRDAIVKRRCGETAGSTLLDDRRQILKLIELRTRRKQIVLNPDVQLIHFLAGLSLRPASPSADHATKRISGRLPACRVAGILRNLLLDKLLEAGGVLEFGEHERRNRLALFIHRD